MAKKSSIEKNNRRKRMAKNAAPARARLKAIIADKKKPMEERFAATLKRGSVEWGDVNEKYKLETPLPDFEPMRIQVDSPITRPSRSIFTRFDAVTSL